MLTCGVEDQVFHGTPENPAKHTQWRPRFNQFTPHQAAVLTQAFTNAGLGKHSTVHLIKTPDLLTSGWIVTLLPAITANEDSDVSETSWVNAPGVAATECVALKVGAQTIFSVDGPAQLILMELSGKLDHYAKMIGLAKTRRQLILNSKTPQLLFNPLIGMPFHDDTTRAFNIGSIAFHSVTLELVTKPLDKLIVNYGLTSRMSKSRGFYAIPKLIGSGATLNDSSVSFALAATNVWLGPQERLSLIHSYQEQMVKEFIQVAQVTVPASNSEHKAAVDLPMKGPVAFVMVTIQSQEDLATGNWTKLCDDTGKDYAKSMMLVTGTTCREDGGWAEFLRTAKVMEAFKVVPQRHIYIHSFETDGTSKHPTGHQNFTNADRIAEVINLHPHPDLVVTVWACTYNAIFGERGTCGRIWLN